VVRINTYRASAVAIGLLPGIGSAESCCFTSGMMIASIIYYAIIPIASVILVVHMFLLWRRRIAQWYWFVAIAFVAILGTAIRTGHFSSITGWYGLRRTLVGKYVEDLSPLLFIACVWLAFKYLRKRDT
jgi:hypothetical protein